MASADLIEACLSSVDRLKDSNSFPEEFCVDLRNRLSAEPKPAKKKKIELNQVDAKKLAKTFGRFGDNLVEGKGLYGAVPLPDEAIAIAAYRKFGALNLTFDCYPSLERIEALKILLLYTKSTLEAFYCSYGHHVDRKQKNTDPNRVLKHCLGQLSEMERIESFVIDYLYIDDEITEVVSKFDNLEIFSAGFQNSDFKNQVNITTRGIECLLQCKNLKMVRICSPLLTKVDGKRIMQKFPNVNLICVPH